MALTNELLLSLTGRRSTIGYMHMQLVYSQCLQGFEEFLQLNVESGSTCHVNRYVTRLNCGSFQTNFSPIEPFIFVKLGKHRLT